MTFIRSRIAGFGHFLPAKVLTNDDLSKMVETSDEWITERTGIKSRHIVEKELTSDMALAAGQKALARAGMKPEELDVIIVATITPDNTTPSVATKVAGQIGARYGMPAFDISAACSGFVYALTMADNMIKLGQAGSALVIGVESLSKLTDWTDRNTCVLFGDGAGAVVLQKTSEDTGILSAKLYSDGTQYDNLKTLGGVSSTQTTGFLFMNGKEVFKAAIGCLSEAAEAVVADAGFKMEDVDWIVPHQANTRIIDGVGKKLEVPAEKVIVTVDHHGNTSAASIPLAFSESMESGKIKKGDLVVFNAMGAGFTWGGVLVRI